MAAIAITTIGIAIMLVLMFAIALVKYTKGE